MNELMSKLAEWSKHYSASELKMSDVREAVGIEFQTHDWFVKDNSNMFTCNVTASIGSVNRRFEYSMGIGHGRLVASGTLDWNNRIVYPDDRQYAKFAAQKAKPHHMTDGDRKSWGRVHSPAHIEAFLNRMRGCNVRACFVVNEPEPDNLFWCLILDSQVTFDHDDHYSYCDEFGMTPSRETEAMYRTCQETARFLSGALGWGTLELLIDVVGSIDY